MTRLMLGIIVGLVAGVWLCSLLLDDDGEKT